MATNEKQKAFQKVGWNPFTGNSVSYIKVDGTTYWLEGKEGMAYIDHATDSQGSDVDLVLEPEDEDGEW